MLGHVLPDYIRISRSCRKPFENVSVEPWGRQHFAAFTTFLSPAVTLWFPLTGAAADTGQLHWTPCALPFVGQSDIYTLLLWQHLHNKLQ